MIKSIHRAAGRCRVGLVTFAALSVTLAFSPAASACPFCANMGKTLSENVAEASMVVYGTLSNARLAENAAPGQPEGTTDFDIITVVRGHAIIEGKKKITLPRYLPAAEGEKTDYLIFAEVIDGKIDPYRGMPIDSRELVDYLAGAAKISKAPTKERLAFFFKHLGNRNLEISGDAYKEFANAPYADVVAAARSFDPDTLIGWLKNPETPTYRIGLYGLLLGASGKPEHAKVLREIVTDPKLRPTTGVDGLIGGYCVLDRKGGVDFAISVLNDANNDFNLRYSALRTMRFVLTELHDVDKKETFARMTESIKISDISDLVIDEFRKNEQWGPLDLVLSLYGKPEYDLQVVRRSVIRFALKCPDPKAKEFVEEIRKADAQLVADVEEILKFEETKLPAAAKTSS